MLVLLLNKEKKLTGKKREKEFVEVVKNIKKRSHGNYDCIVPVSGGKDSTWQVIKMLEFDLKILCVNSRTCDFSEIGKKNLENIKKLGVDMLEFSPDPNVRKKLNKIGLFRSRGYLMARACWNFYNSNKICC